jgi:hypothetical protein
LRAVVFGSSGIKQGSKEYEDAYAVGKLLAAKGFDVLNGGHTGVMEAVSKGAREAGGKAIGVTAKHIKYAPTNKYLSEVIITEDLFERMRTYFKDIDLVVVMPGGSGTLTELMLSCDLMGFGLIKNKPILAFDYWKPAVELVKGKVNILKGLDNVNLVSSVDEIKEFLNKNASIN